MTQPATKECHLRVWDETSRVSVLIRIDARGIARNPESRGRPKSKLAKIIRKAQRRQVALHNDRRKGAPHSEV